MYWATGFANELSLQSCSGGNEAEEDLEDTKNTTDSAYFPQSLDIVCIQPTSQAAFFVSCTQSSIQLWSVKVNGNKLRIELIGVNGSIFLNHNIVH
jgi:hypothetical protein